MVPFISWPFLSQSHFVGYCLLVRIICDQAFNFWNLFTKIFHPPNSIYFVKCYCQAAQQHNSAAPEFHDWCLPPNLTTVIIAKQFHFSIIRPEDVVLKISAPVCSCSLFFVLFVFVIIINIMMCLWSTGFFLAKWLDLVCIFSKGLTVFTVDIDIFVPFLKYIL